VVGAPFLVVLGALSSRDVRGIRSRASVKAGSPENSPYFFFYTNYESWTCGHCNFLLFFDL